MTKTMDERMADAGISEGEMTEILECAWFALRYGNVEELGGYLDLNDEYLAKLRTKVHKIQNDNLGEEG
jgi:hypothetical protein